MKKVVVIVPVYKEKLSEVEQISYNQLTKILVSYDICFICSFKLNAEYLIGRRIKRFNDAYFDGIEGYNQLMLSEEFYSSFLEYEYILIYQLDAFVFYDRLEEFCDLDYDYIGAPWVTGFRCKTDEGFRYVNVGNGGLSLRNVSACLGLLQRNKKEVESYFDNEDKFFAFHNGGEFKVAPIEIALQFSFEREVRKCYKLNNNQIPFGCHAWAKYDFDFWKPVIEKSGFDLNRLQIEGKLDEENQNEYEQAGKNEIFWTYREKINLKNFEKKEVFIWGTGMYGRHMMKLFEQSGVSIQGFLDNNADFYGKKIKEVEIYAPSIIMGDVQYLVVIAITGTAGNEVKNQLLDMGKVYKRDFLFYYDLVCSV